MLDTTLAVATIRCSLDSLPLMLVRLSMWLDVLEQQLHYVASEQTCTGSFGPVQCQQPLFLSRSNAVNGVVSSLSCK